MTVKKAYDQLEQEGYIVTKQGKGSFVAPQNMELVKEEMQKEIEKHILQIIELAKSCDLKKEEITKGPPSNHDKITAGLLHHLPG